jgi:FkbM family methyltransferase
MPILHRLRKAANKFLSPLGLEVERVEKQPWFRPKLIATRVGNFQIQIPSTNPLANLYRRNPGYTSHLGRLAALVKRKYSDLVAMDIGANVGDTACIIESAGAIPLFCVEGDDFSFSVLEKNLRQFSDARAFKMFLGEKSEAVGVTMAKDGWNTTLIPDAAGGTKKISLVSLDDFLSPRPEMPRIKLLKIDTEGFDCSIIRGAKKFLRQTHPVITFEYNRDNMAALGENGLDTLALLADLGYEPVVFHDCDGRFFDATTLADERFLRNIHEYADGKHAAVYYFDLTVFPQADRDLADAFMKDERARRAGSE